MRIVFASIFAVMIGSTIGNAQSPAKNTGRWCIVNASDNVRHCYFRRHADCIKAISDGNGLCVPSEKRRGETLEK
jgi:hypothetical protein